VAEAENKILALAKKYSLEIKDLPKKPLEYLRVVRTEIYRQITGEGDKIGEMKMK
jgi:hypothetical protein